MKKIIAIVSGGYSDEATISFGSSEVVAKHLDTNKFIAYRIFIDRQQWTVRDGEREYPINRHDFSFEKDGDKISFDGVFNAIHGSPGEDGKLAAYFEMLGIPYNTCGVLTSALTFNKGTCNTYLKQLGIRSATSTVIFKSEGYDEAALLKEIGLPCFVKPNEAGSSLGISRVNRAEDLGGAIEKAFAEDEQVIVESFIEGTEITCGVITIHGEAKPLAVTEIVSEKEFFDYEAKYHHSGTQEITPARISEEHYQRCMDQTVKIYGLLNCRGMIRADYIQKGDELFLIEVNTVPGLSEKSLMPQQAVHAGMSLTEFFTASIEEMYR